MIINLVYQRVTGLRKTCRELIPSQQRKAEIQAVQPYPHASANGLLEFAFQTAIICATGWESCGDIAPKKLGSVAAYQPVNPH